MRNELWTIPAVLMILMAGAPSCQFRKDDGKVSGEDVRVLLDRRDGEKAENAQAAEIAAPKNVMIGFRPEAAPNVYRLVITWPAELPLASLWIDGVDLGDFSSGRYETTESLGDVVKVRFEAKNSQGQVIATIDRELLKPKDLLILEGRTLKGDEVWRYGRVFFGAPEAIVTDGWNLTIEADELIAEDVANIRNFGENDESPLERTSDLRKLRNGRITVRAKKMTGEFRFRLNGLDGRHGMNGADRKDEAPPRGKGEKGRPGTTTLGPECPKDQPGCVRELICGRAPGRGKMGPEGAKGWPGENGSDGGSTGSLEVAVQDYLQAQVSAERYPGSPGNGGEGGPGFPGGEGGDGGDAIIVDSKVVCPAGLLGLEGPTGPNGNPGRRGEQGRLGEVIFPQTVDAAEHFKIFGAF